MGRNRLAAEVDLLARRHGLAVTRSRALGGEQRAYETFRPLYEALLNEGAAKRMRVNREIDIRVVFCDAYEVLLNGFCFLVTWFAVE